MNELRDQVHSQFVARDEEGEKGGSMLEDLLVDEQTSGSIKSKQKEHKCETTF